MPVSEGPEKRSLLRFRRCRRKVAVPIAYPILHFVVRSLPQSLIFPRVQCSCRITCLIPHSCLDGLLLRGENPENKNDHLFTKWLSRAPRYPPLSIVRKWVDFVLCPKRRVPIAVKALIATYALFVHLSHSGLHDFKFDSQCLVRKEIESIPSWIGQSRKFFFLSLEIPSFTRLDQSNRFLNP